MGRPASARGMVPPSVALLALTLLAGRAAGEDPPRLPADPSYQTVVRAPGVEETQPEDDPAGFASIIRFRDPVAGVGLPRLLARVPGLRFREGGPSGRQTVTLRGAESHQVAVFLDGIRLSTPRADGVDLSLIDPCLLQQAEVRRGGASARFGTDAVGGALLLQTPRLRSSARTRAQVSYASFDSLSLGVSRRASLGQGRWRYLASGSYRMSGGRFPYVDDNGVERWRENNDSRLGEVLLKGDHLFDRWQLELLDDFSVAERGAPGMSQRPSATARQDELRNLTALRFVRRDTLLDGGKLALLLAHRYGRYRFDEPSPPVVRSAHQSFTAEGSARLELPLARVGRLDAGLELRGSFFRDPDTDNPSRFEADLWIAGQTRLLRDHLVVVPAVRLATASGEGAVVIPRFGLVLRPLRWSRRPALVALEVAANIGRAFRRPTFQELYMRLDGFGGNPDLAAEDALDGDVGLRWRRAFLALEAAYFQRRIKNVILFAPVSSFLVRADNYRGALAQGVESSLRAGPLLGLTLHGSYTFTRTRFGDPAMSLPGHPAHRGTARLGWERPAAGEGGLGLELWTGLTAESATVLSRFNSLEEEARLFLAVGGALAYRWLSLTAEGNNLLDKRDAVDAVGFPLPPARFFVSLAVTL